ncbi:MAG: M28 family peptidase [Flavobacteriales bacterium]|nr:M28 family peptidase [Flavobacteriales bacterium]
MRNRVVAVVLVALFLALLLLRSCAPDNGSNTPTIPKVTPEQQALPPTPLFDPDSAYGFVKKQVDFGPRVPGTAQHTACGDWLVAYLKQHADTVIEQIGSVTAFNGQRLPLRNIIASWRPELKARVLLMAHWDTRPFADKDNERQGEPILGANDGGSGVGILLEVARHLRAHPSDIGVDVFFTDVEDYGEPSGAMSHQSSDTWCLGAQYWTKNPHVKNYTARFGILLDMCGARDARFPKEGWSMQLAPQITNRVWNTAEALGYGDRFVDEVRQYVGVDDHVSVNQRLRIPTIDIIEYNQGTQAFHPSWHTHDDDMDVIDPATLKAVGQTVLEVVWKER